MQTSPKVQRALEQAIEAYKQRDFARADGLLEPIVDNADALYLRGLIALEARRNEDAAGLFQGAVRGAPNNPGFRVNLGEAYRKLGRLEDAAAAYHGALEIAPDMVEAHFNLGLALDAANRLEEALQCFDRAARLRPNLAHIQKRLATALRDVGRLDDAIQRLLSVVKANPNDARAHNNLGVLVKDAGDAEGSIACFRRALAVDPQFLEAHSNLLYTLSFVAGYDAGKILEEARDFQHRHADAIARLPEVTPKDYRGDRRLRIGYVSPDFRDHCQALFMLPLLRQHDREAFEIFCYSSVQRPDATTEQLRSLVQHWRDIRALDDQAAAELIRNDGIDILVDLTMHMSSNRPLLFARKPAPVQVAWLAYPGTTGLSSIQYRLTDPHLDPVDAPETSYSEASIRLPDTFWCYDPLIEELEAGNLPADRNGFVTFGCLNNFCKVNDGVLELWARVLKSVHRSRLVLLAQATQAREQTLAALAHHGVARDRVTFVGFRPRAAYLELYREIDICLDTVPYNGHTTSLDAFWMGVPVVTLVGDTVVGRAGLCQAMNLSLPELVAKTPDAYARTAKQIAENLPWLRELRGSLRERMKTSPLMDAPRFARNLEEAYRKMWWDVAGRAE